jgi:hypothetical protein
MEEGEGNERQAYPANRLAAGSGLLGLQQIRQEIELRRWASGTNRFSTYRSRCVVAL